MEIQEIKQRLSLLTALHHYGLKPNKNGMLKCPFHVDDTASMKIYPQTNTFNCFGCGKNGDQIEFCTLKEGNKHKGLLKATELTGELQPINSKPKQPYKENHTEILTRIFESFRNGLQSPISKRLKEYLQQRNLDLTKLEIGYNSGQFHHHGKLSEADQKACINAGLLIPYNGSVPNRSGTTYTSFAKDCIIFPLKDNAGIIMSLYGRSITNNDKSKHFYLKDRHGLYPCYPKPETTRLILTEAIIDAATLLQIPEITAEYEILSCYGTNGLTEEHKAAIKQLQSLEEIIFFFDGDKAGRDAIKKYHEEFLNELPGVKLSAVETPENEDINSLLQGHEPEIFTHLLENRKDLFLSFENKTFRRGNDFLSHLLKAA
jgi:DNA primase